MDDQHNRWWFAWRLFGWEDTTSPGQRRPILPIPRGERLVLLLLLAVAALLGNVAHIRLGFAVDFVFGSLAVMLAVQLFGVSWAVILAALAGLGSYLIWQHPYAVMFYICEALVVGLCWHWRMRRPLVVYDGVYWLLVGVPLTNVILGHAGLSEQQATLVVLVYAVNGIANALLASLLVNYTSLRDNMRPVRPDAGVPLRNCLFDLLVASVYLPVLIALLYRGRAVQADIEGTIGQALRQESRTVQDLLVRWEQDQLRTITYIATVAPHQSDAMLAGSFEALATDAPAFRQLLVTDARGRIRTAVRAAGVEPLDSYADDPVFQRFQRDWRGTAAHVEWQQDNGYLHLSRPVYNGDVFAGMVRWSSDLEALSELLPASIFQSETRVALSSPDREHVITLYDSGIVREVEQVLRLWTRVERADRLVLFEPPLSEMPRPLRWKRSFYSYERPLGSRLPLQLQVSARTTHFLPKFERRYMYELAALLALAAGAFLLAAVASRPIVRPLTLLQQVTTNLPNRLHDNRPVEWPHSPIGEIAGLVRNFGDMAGTLRAKFLEIEHWAGTLEDRVKERTEELQAANERLREEIKARREAEASLRLLSTAVQQANDAMLITTAQLELPGPQIIFANQGAARLTGYSVEELVGRTPRILQGEETERVVLEDLRAALTAGQEWTGELTNYRRDGAAYKSELRISPVRDRDGRITHYLSVENDVTERRQQADRLAGLNRMFLQLGADFNANIRHLGATVGRLLGADVAIYHRRRGDVLVCLGDTGETPPPELILGPLGRHLDPESLGEEPEVLVDLPHHPQYREDLLVQHFRARSAMLQCVSVRGEASGTIALFFRHDTTPDDSARNVVEIVANAMAIEEERERNAAALQQRVEFEQIVTSLSTEFINLDLDDIDRGIETALQVVGHFEQVDHALILLLSPSGRSLDGTYEWAAPGLATLLEAFANLPTDELAHTLEQLRAGQTLHVPDVEALPADSGERRVMAAQGLKSMVAVPMRRRGELIGCLAFSTVRRPKSWSQDSIALMQIVGEMVANALGRKETEGALRATSTRLRSLIDNLQMGVLMEDLGGRIVHANEDFPELFELPVASEAMIGRNISEVFAGVAGAIAEAGTFFAACRALRRTGELTRNCELPIRGGRFFEYDYVPIRLAAEVSGHLWIFRDITERKKAERELALAREAEVAVASAIQKTLLLGQAPVNFPDLQATALTVASQQVDGDFYDFIRYDDRAVDMIVGDVMGKGVAAALLGAATKSHTIRAINRLVTGSGGAELPGLAEILRLLQNAMARQLMDLDSFVTLVYARFIPATRRLEYVDCGHTSTFHCTATGDCHRLSGENMPLGFVDDDVFAVNTIDLAEGDILVFYSDGLTEARNATGELFGEERLRQLVRDHRHMDSRELVATLHDEVVTYARTDKLNDDLTCIVVKIGPPVAAGKARGELETCSDLANLHTVRQFVRELGRRAPEGRWTEEDEAHLVLAVNEAFTNIVRHAYGGRDDGGVWLRGEIGDTAVHVTLEHQGLTVDPATLKISEPVLDGSREGGFGLYIMNQAVDEVRYENRDGNSCIYLRKDLRASPTT